ncbi:MAG TPA: hypothetical protein VK553_02315, partial [Candidatus Nitrosopolaris rasttigaisensis]|nr:hypothetical protein [Candidatus Nitrosopolaris rasttigaisensis]
IESLEKEFHRAINEDISGKSIDRDKRATNKKAIQKYISALYRKYENAIKEGNKIAQRFLTGKIVNFQRNEKYMKWQLLNLQEGIEDLENKFYQAINKFPEVMTKKEEEDITKFVNDIYSGNRLTKALNDQKSEEIFKEKLANIQGNKEYRNWRRTKLEDAIRPGKEKFYQAIAKGSARSPEEEKYMMMFVGNIRSSLERAQKLGDTIDEMFFKEELANIQGNEKYMNWRYKKLREIVESTKERFHQAIDKGSARSPEEEKYMIKFVDNLLDNIERAQKLSDVIDEIFFKGALVNLQGNKEYRNWRRTKLKESINPARAKFYEALAKGSKRSAEEEKHMIMFVNDIHNGLERAQRLSDVVGEIFFEEEKENLERTGKDIGWLPSETVNLTVSDSDQGGRGYVKATQISLNEICY